MAEDLEAQKVIITSILSAHKGGMLLSKFQKEYKSVQGHHVPFAKFGCATFLQFLNKFSDAVEVVPMFGGKVALRAKVNHDVGKAFKRQKPVAEKMRNRHKNNASTHKEHTYVQSLSVKKVCPALVQQSIPVTMQPFQRLEEDTCIHTTCCTDIGNCQSQDKGLDVQAIHTIPSGHTNEPRSLEQSRMAGAQTGNAPSFPSRSSDQAGQGLIVCGHKDNNNKTSSDLVIGVPDVVAACIKSLLQKYRSGLELEELLEKCKEKVGNIAYLMQRKHIEVIQDVLFSMSSVCVVADSEQKFRVMIHRSDTDEQNPATSLSDQLISQLISVLIDHPEGLEISELLKLHHAQFGEHGYIKDLSPSTSDFVQKVLIKIPQTVVINHGNGTYSVKLQRERPIHPHIQQRSASFASAENTSVPCIARAYSVQELPNSLIFPVVVGKVFSPSEFYILLTDDSLIYKRNNLVQELNLLYCTVPAEFYPVSSEDLKPGLVCAALCAHDGKQIWQRAVVRRVTAYYVRVSCIDHGAVALVSICNIRRLRSDFLQLPAQAIKASLANVKPRSQKSWLCKAKDRFLQLVSKNDCMCSVVSRKDDIFFVELTRATDGADHASSLTDTLVVEGLAQSTKMSEERTSGNFMDTWTLSEGQHVTVITWNSVKYMSAVGISKLFGCDSDLVSRKLTQKGISLQRALLDRKCDPAFHYRICLCDGTFTADDIPLYLLVNVPDILRLLQHPSQDLADELEIRSLEPGAILDISSTLLPPDAEEEDNLQMKLDFYMQTRDSLRMAASQNPSPSTVSQLNYVEQKVYSLACLLEQWDRMDVHQHEQEKESTP